MGSPSTTKVFGIMLIIFTIVIAVSNVWYMGIAFLFLGVVLFVTIMEIGGVLDLN